MRQLSRSLYAAQVGASGTPFVRCEVADVGEGAGGSDNYGLVTPVYENDMANITKVLRGNLVTPTRSGYGKSIWAYMGYTPNGINARAYVYLKSDGSLVGQTDEYDGSNIQADSWHEFEFSSRPALTASTDYWIFVTCSASYMEVAYKAVNNGVTYAYYNAAQYPPPDPIVTGDVYENIERSCNVYITVEYDEVVYDTSDRVLAVKQWEGEYEDGAEILLDNSDEHFSTRDYVGCLINLGFGFTT